MKDFEAFLDGGGRMAGLLGALPRFEPPAGMEARVLAALAGDPAVPGSDGRFEPPAALAERVLAEAALIDAAQGPRRQAALHDLARLGAAQALGGELGRSSERWLKSQPAPASAAPGLARRPTRRWLMPLGGALAATLALGVALQVMREPASDPMLEAYRESAPAAAPAAPPMEQASGPIAKPTAAPEAPPPASKSVPHSASLAASRPAPSQAAPQRQAPADPAQRQQMKTERKRADLAKSVAEPAIAPASPPAPAPAGRASALRDQAQAVLAPPAAEAEAPAAASAEIRSVWPLVLDLGSRADEIAARLPAGAEDRWQVSVASSEHARATVKFAEVAELLRSQGRRPELRVVVGAVAAGRAQIEPILPTPKRKEPGSEDPG